MKREELTVDQIEEINGGMYQGYGGVERPGIMSKDIPSWMTPRGPGMMGSSDYNKRQYVPEPEPQPERKVPPHGGMGTGFIGPGINNYYIG